MSDKIYLGDEAIYNTGAERTGYNDNVLIIGSTGAGKTMSVNIPTALNLSDSSTVMSFSKRKDAEMMIKSFKDRGYNIIDFDLTGSKEPSVGYIFDPLDYIYTDEDIMNLSQVLINAGVEDMVMDADTKYWNGAAANIISAFISVLKMTDIPSAVLSPYCNDRQPVFADLMRLNDQLRFTEAKDGVKCPLDSLFEEVRTLFGDCMAVRCYKTLRGLSMKTASCIASVVNETLASFLTPTFINKYNTDGIKHIDLHKLGTEKTALIITVSPINKAMDRYLSVFHYQLFKCLFEDAEKNEGHLAIPIQVFMDDFGNSPVGHFEDYISIFREAGISTIMFIQSMKQLDSIYGKSAAIIRDNCGTLCFFSGSQDLDTCRELSIRIDKPLEDVLSMPIGKIIICRNGEKPKIADRYPTFTDPLYKQYCL